MSHLALAVDEDFNDNFEMTNIPNIPFGNFGKGGEKVTPCSGVFHWISFAPVSVDPAEDPQAEPDSTV